MGKARVRPVAAQRNFDSRPADGLSVVAWALLIWQGAGHNGGMHLASPTMELRAPLFVAIWMVMTVAMMFPTAAPDGLVFHRVQSGKVQRGEAFVATWDFWRIYAGLDALGRRRLRRLHRL